MSMAEKLSTGPFSAGKKSGMKREVPPCTYKRKARGKEAKRDYLGNLVPAQSRAGARTRVKEPPRACSPAEAGWAAQHIVRTILRCPQSNHRLWSAFCLYNSPDDIIQLAYEYASYGRQGEVSNPVTAFQAKLNEKYPETVAYLVARKRARQGGVKAVIADGRSVEDAVAWARKEARR